MADALMLTVENLAMISGGRAIRQRWAEVLDQKPEDTRSCEEITADIVARCGLEVKKAP